jgi:amidase
MSLAESLAETIGSTGIAVGGVTVARLAEALDGGRLTAGDLTAFYLARIGRLNPDLHAVITASPMAAAEAAASDERGHRGARIGPLDGIPVLIKDNISADGLPATAGSPALERAAATDAFLVGRLRAAGAVILGKANLSEWANFRSRPSSSGLSVLGGQTVNPHGAGRSPSGSSSGSAAAMAAGLAPLTVGTETDGSIVSPAGACGIVGIKPTVGLVSRSGIVPISAAQDTAGPMTRTVADAAVLLAAMAGPDSADPATERAAAEACDFAAYLQPDALAGARIGVWRQGSKDADRRTMAILESALARLRAQGSVLVDPVELADIEKADEPETVALTLEFKHDINAYLAGLGGDHPADLAGLIAFNIGNEAAVLRPFGQEQFEASQATSGDLADPDYRAARSAATGTAGLALDRALSGDDLDAIVTLTGHPAWLTDPVLGDAHRWGTSGPAAVAGYPSVTVPAGMVSGLPVGLSFIGPAWSEPRLIALAHAFEIAGG